MNTVKAFKTTDEKVFATQEEAQRHEVSLIPRPTDDKADHSDFIMRNKDRILEILKPARKAKTARTGRARVSDSAPNSVCANH